MHSPLQDIQMPSSLKNVVPLLSQHSSKEVTFCISGVPLHTSSVWLKSSTWQPNVRKDTSNKLDIAIRKQLETVGIEIETEVYLNRVVISSMWATENIFPLWPHHESFIAIIPPWNNTFMASWTALVRNNIKPKSFFRVV